MKTTYFTDTTSGDRPEDEGDHAVDVAGGGLDQVVVDGEDGLDGVERAGADVAEDDTQRAQGQRQPPLGGMAGILSHKARILLWPWISRLIASASDDSTLTCAYTARVSRLSKVVLISTEDEAELQALLGTLSASVHP